MEHFVIEAALRCALESPFRNAKPNTELRLPEHDKGLSLV